MPMIVLILSRHGVSGIHTTFTLNINTIIKPPTNVKMRLSQPRTLASFLLAPVSSGQKLGNRQTVTPSLLGPVNLGVPSTQIDSISISLITFADEVFDISGISIFGNVNDGSMNCTAETEAADAAVLGPVTLPAEGAREINLSLITFGDEVFDISNIAIFGDVNDGGCD